MTRRVVVVGSGPTGAAAASELVEAGVEVLMLESAQRRPAGLVVRAASHTVYRRGTSEGLRSDRHAAAPSPVEWFSARAFGGLTNYWAGSVPRFAPSDFTEGGRIDERFVWPISYEDLVPFYERIERVMRVTAGSPLSNVPEPVATYHRDLPADWAAVAARFGEPGRIGPSMAVMPRAQGRRWMLARRAREFNSYDVIIRPLLENPLFTLAAGKHVLRLEASSAGSTIDTVVVLDRERRTIERIRGAAIILAAGVLDTTEILLRSRLDDHPSGLGNNTGVLGCYLHDHPRQWSTLKLRQPMSALPGLVYLSRRDPEDSEPLRAAAITLVPADQNAQLNYALRRPVDVVGANLFATTIPDPAPSVTLVGDVHDDPDRSALAIDFAYDDRTKDFVNESRKRCVENLRLAGLQIAESDEDPDIGLPGSSVHLGGTARMHASREFGVVDGENRLHDAPEVLVCDTACFTTGPEKNPALTAMAIAARAANRLAARLK